MTSIAIGVHVHEEPDRLRATLAAIASHTAAGFELFLLPDLDQDISATEIRAAMAEGSTPQTVLPSAVAEYIRSHGLYRQVEIP